MTKKRKKLIESSEGSRRKEEHLDLSLNGDVENGGLSPGFENYRFIHQALPELNFDSIDTGINIFGRKLSAPLMISPITGGTMGGGRLNIRLAELAQKKNIAMGIGSQRIAIEDGSFEESFKVRKTAPDILLFANLGAVQLNHGFGPEQCKRAVDMIEADALMLHLNPMQEVFQDGGDHDFSNLAKKIAGICKKVQFPVIVREVGFGISADAAKMLAGAGVAGIDVGGAGGTSWIKIESSRSKDPVLKNISKSFMDWGIPTAESLEMVSGVSSSIKIIASGGIRTGLDVAKAIALGADIAGAALPILRASTGSAGEAEDFIDEIIMGLKVAMFGIGASNILGLKNNKYLVKKDRAHK
ncbi:MAG: type 2 isopentenyl-diphosphate Delta-isomerase [Actinobacteria bacterium]|nr:type 2 isopentenyl-diphosphate Delta-isomerase [Actinomycetota bacterium]